MSSFESKYPIGKFTKPERISQQDIQSWIQNISSFPERLKKEVLHLSIEQLDSPYREDGWTIRQVVHHCADSHINSLMRFKLALTEDNPTIRPYFEERWAELNDSKKTPIEPSLKILEGIHERWVVILSNLSGAELERTYIHPDYQKTFRIDETIGIYSWHCNHHLAHITELKKRKNWD